MTIKAVLFDLDGTLLDTAPDLWHALNLVLQEDGKAPLPYEQVRPWASHGSAGLLKLGYAADPASEEFAELRRRFLDHYSGNLVRETRLFDGMQETLQEILQRGLTWGIVTNKPAAYTDPLVAQIPWPSAPACVVSGDSAALPKPDPGSIIMACEQIACAPENCLYVGDADRDIDAAVAAGMPGLVALWGYIQAHEQPETWGAQALIESPADLTRWMDSE